MRGPLRINIVLPFPATRPGGGVKVMYEYANRLQQKGHRVTILHSLRRPYKKMKSPLWWKQLLYRLRGAAQPKWFQLHEGIRSLIVPEITNEHVPDADIVMCTWWEMAFMISRLDRSKGIPFNLIQDHEVWKGNQELVHQSYRLPIHHLVISRWLQELVKGHSEVEPVHIPNAIDTNRFARKVPAGQRKPASIIMLYSEEERKGSKFGIAALEVVKRSFPELSATLFGVFAKPDLPEWVQYVQKPPDLPSLYNQHAIFFSPSLGEGWALPPAEAMASGCAVVCTDIGGHRDYTIQDRTAMLVPPKNVDAMAKSLSTLISDHQMRNELAENAYLFITQTFSWEASVQKLENIFYESLD